MITKNGSGIWLGPTYQKRFLWRNHDALYIAIGRVRIRIMKPDK